VRTIQRILIALAASAIAAPAVASAAAPEVDFEWYASVGRQVGSTPYSPPARAGYIWSPGQWTTHHGTRQSFVAGHWIVDDFAAQVATYNPGPHVVVVVDPRGELIVQGPVPSTPR